MDPQKIYLSGKLGEGKFCFVDAEDFERLNKYKWSLHDNGAVRNQNDKLVFMQHEIVKPGKGFLIDHRNRNNLDNRKANLRICTKSQNSMNRGLQANNTSGYRGVSFNKVCKKWEAYIKLDGKRRRLGLYKNKEKAAKAYDGEANKLFGEFAYLNMERSNYAN